MKKLIYERKDAIQAQISYFNAVADNCNKIVENFKSYNYFDVSLDDEQLWELVKNPIAFFDDLLLKGNPIPVLKGVNPSVEKIAETLGVNRKAYSEGCILPIPGAGYRGQHPFTTSKLSDSNKKMLKLENSIFIVNSDAVNDFCNQFRVFAESTDDLKLVSIVENLANSMNEAIEAGLVSKIHLNSIYQICNYIDTRAYKCEIHDRNLGELLRVNQKRQAS